MLDKGHEQFLVDEPEEDGEYAYLGNAGEACNLGNAWMQSAIMTPELIEALRTARNARLNNGKI